MEQETLLTEVEFQPVYASVGKRFLNYFIDVIIFYLFLITIGLFVALSENEVNTTSNNLSDSQLFVQVFMFIFFALYYFLSELIFNGRTIGKFITGTKAINEDGTQMEPKTILLRSLSRIVPFEAFSAFDGHPWHDKWTKTIVIDVRKTALNDITAQ